MIKPKFTNDQNTINAKADEILKKDASDPSAQRAKFYIAYSSRVKFQKKIDLADNNINLARALVM